MNTKNIIIAVLVIVIVILFSRNWSLMFTNKQAITETNRCAVGAFLVDKNVSVSQFKFDVNTPTTRNLRTLKTGDCITGFTKRMNSIQEERIVDAQGFDITNAGAIVTA